MEHSKRNSAVCALIGASLLFASLGVVGRCLSLEYSIFQQTYIRTLGSFLFALVFFWGSISYQKITLISYSEWLLIVFRSACMYIVGVCLFVYGLLTMKYGIASLVASFPFVAIFGSLWYQERLTLSKIGALALAIFGLCVLSVRTDFSVSFGISEAAVVISSIGFGVAYVSRKSHTALLNDSEITALMFFTGTLLLIVCSAIADGIVLPQMPDSAATYGVMLLGSLMSACALWLLNVGFSRVSILFADVVLMLEIPFAITIGYVLYSEFFTHFEVVGTLVICTAVYLLHREEQVQ